MIRYIWGSLVVGLTFYIAMIYGSTAIALLGFAEAVFVVLSLLFLIYLSDNLSFELEVPITMVDQGQGVRVQVRGQNTSSFSCSKIRCRMHMDNGYLHQRQNQWIWAHFGRSDYNCDYDVIMKQAGWYEIRLDKLRVYDMSGIFYITKKIHKCVSIEVVPDITQVQIKMTEGALHFIGDSDVYDEHQAGNDPSETFQIREFQDGDKIQSIHWKLSAKTETLMVRENSQPKACPVVLLLEAGNGWSSDGALKIATSLSFSMLDAGCSHYIAWYSMNNSEVIRIRVDDEEGFYQFLMYYMKEVNINQKRSTEEMYEEKYKENMLHSLVVTSDLGIYLDGKLQMNIKEKQLESELQKLELIL